MMQRENLTPRPDWRERFEELGFYFHSIDGIYWDETACWHFSEAEIDLLDDVTVELHQMCLNAVAEVINKRRYAQFAIPPEFIPYIEASWAKREPSLFGRFDFSYDGVNPPKLLEYNADTPTSLIEASVAQWNWLQAVYPQHDQFNSLHEKLIARWQALRETYPLLYFASVKDQEEDFGNLEYLRDTALQAGIDARRIDVEDIGWSEEDRRFVDLDNAYIPALFKLYPWEWLVREEFGANLLRAPIKLIEPPWKMLLSNKAILAVLWELYPGHRNLLPCYFSRKPFHGPYVEKPLYSREGANVTLHTPTGNVFEPGGYGAEGFVYQGYAPLPEINGSHMVIGSWIIGDEAAGLGIREDESPITKNTSRFLPHYFS